MTSFSLARSAYAPLDKEMAAFEEKDYNLAIDKVKLDMELKSKLELAKIDSEKLERQSKLEKQMKEKAINAEIKKQQTDRDSKEKLELKRQAHEKTMEELKIKAHKERYAHEKTMEELKIKAHKEMELKRYAHEKDMQYCKLQFQKEKQIEDARERCKIGKQAEMVTVAIIKEQTSAIERLEDERKSAVKEMRQKREEFLKELIFKAKDPIAAYEKLKEEFSVDISSELAYKTIADLSDLSRVCEINKHFSDGAAKNSDTTKHE